MEAFLLALDALIEEHESLTVVDLLGALQLTQQRIVFDMLTDDPEEDEE